MSSHTGTNATFGGDAATQAAPAGVITSMLKEYLPYELLFEELVKRDYLLTKVDKDQSWKGGELSVPFMGGRASSFAYGELTDINAITQDRPVRGKVSEYREIWGSMIFHQKDLDTHTDMAQSFLKILPDRLEDFIERMKEAISVNLLNGSHFDTIKGVANQATGELEVSRPSRFQIGQYVTIGSTDENLGTADFLFEGYVRNINMDTSEIELVDLQDVFDGAAAIVVMAGVTVTDNVYLRGVLGAAPGLGNVVTRGFTSLKSQLLSRVNGGSANLFGVQKTVYPHLQAVNISGVGYLANILPSLFSALMEIKQKGKGNPTDAIMSYNTLSYALAQLEEGAGGTTYGRQFTAGDSKVNAYGWTEIAVSGFGGTITLVGVHEMDDDAIYMMDWRSLKLFSNGFFERRQAPDGKEYYEDRAPTGYRYVIDTRFYGELVLSKPSHCGIIHGLT